jgi:hypothetical protein
MGTAMGAHAQAHRAAPAPGAPRLPHPLDDGDRRRGSARSWPFALIALGPQAASRADQVTAPALLKRAAFVAPRPIGGLLEHPAIRALPLRRHDPLVDWLQLSFAALFAPRIHLGPFHQPGRRGRDGKGFSVNRPTRVCVRVCARTRVGRSNPEIPSHPFPSLPRLCPVGHPSAPKSGLPGNSSSPENIAFLVLGCCARSYPFAATACENAFWLPRSSPVSAHHCVQSS